MRVGLPYRVSCIIDSEAAANGSRSVTAPYNRRPDSVSVEYVFPRTMFLLQSAGGGIHNDSGQKKGCVRMMQPICGSGACALSVLMYARIESEKSKNDAAPLCSPKMFHATESCSLE